MRAPCCEPVQTFSSPSANRFQGPRTGLRFQFGPGPGQGALDVAGPGVVTFDQVRVVAVHDPDHVGQLDRTVGMEVAAKTVGSLLDLDGQVREVRRDPVLEEAWFDPEWGLDHHCRSRT